MDGRLIDGYPVATDETDSVNDDTLNLDKKGQCISVQKYSSTDKEKKLELFLKNAFRFLANKERILTDSRVFLCPIPVQSGMTISGTSGFMNPTLGVYLQWWDACSGALRTDENGRRSLVFKLSGSNLSGVNKSGEVFEDGSVGYDCLRPFKSYWYPFVKINNAYTEAKNKYQAYTLEQVTEILEREEMGDMAYAHTINERFHTAEIKTLNERVNYLNAQNKALEERYQNAMLRWKEDRIVKYYNEYVALEMRVESEISLLSEQKRELRAACGFVGKNMRSKFDAYVSRLQMASYIVTEDFVYPVDKHGREYGFGWSLLTTPERVLGKEACQCSRTPEESYQRMMDHLSQLLPFASEKQITKLIK